MVKELPDISKIASALSNESKFLMLDALMDGRGHTLLELAKTTGITPQTACYHLKGFCQNNWVRMEKSGRFHYFFLVNPQVAELIEQFSPVSQERNTKSLTRSLKVEKIRQFRSCYDHMAGEIGVLITDQLMKNKLLIENHLHGYDLTPKGIHFFKNKLEINIDTLHQEKRRFSTQCLDWSERRHHLGGALGKALFSSFRSKELVVRKTNEKRALLLTVKGSVFLRKELNATL